MYKKIIVLVIGSTLLTACVTQQSYGYNNNVDYNDNGYNSRENRHSNALIGGGVGATWALMSITSKIDRLNANKMAGRKRHYYNGYGDE